MIWNLAQLNIAKMKYGEESPEMQDFNDAIDAVNALADESPGFVWRLDSDEEEGDGALIFDDPGYIVNISLWENLESLVRFIRSELHLSIMRRRQEWFSASDAPTLVLWWVPEGHIPTVAEAQERLEALRRDGSSEGAFGLADRIPAPGDGI